MNGAPPVIALLRSYLRPYRLLVVVALGLLFISAIGNLFLPDLNGDIINDGIVTGDVEVILRIGAVMLAVTAAIGVASVAAVYLAARILYVPAYAFGWSPWRSAIFAVGAAATGVMILVALF